MKINEKNLAAFASSGNQVDKEGYLMKRGDGNKGFAKRWFVLKGNLLFYFDKKTDREPVGVIILEGSTIELAETEMDEHYCFKIVFPSRSYILSAEDHQLMEQWMKALACASYDYVKLMAAELQRQLNELYAKPMAGERSLLFPTMGEGAMASSDLSSQHHSSSKPGHAPTPPPRSRSARHARDKAALPERKPFGPLHKGFGAKILQDQEKRWASQDASKSANPQAPLSVLRQNTLIEL